MRLNEKELKEMEDMNYLSSTFITDGEMKVNVCHRVSDGVRMMGGLVMDEG